MWRFTIFLLTLSIATVHMQDSFEDDAAPAAFAAPAPAAPAPAPQPLAVPGPPPKFFPFNLNSDDDSVLIYPVRPFSGRKNTFYYYGQFYEPEYFYYASDREDPIEATIYRGDFPIVEVP